MTDFNNFKEQYETQNKRPIKVGGPKAKAWFAALGVAFGIIVLLVLMAGSFTFTVGEREQAVVTQFGKIVRVIVDDAQSESVLSLQDNPRFAGVRIESGKGLFFKAPFIQSVVTYSNMLLTYDTNAESVFTKDKKTIVLDNYAQWEIVNPALFLLNIGSESAAHQRIDEFIYSMIREQVGKVDAHTLVTDKSYMQTMLSGVEDYVNRQLATSGVRIVDIRVKRTEYPDDTKPSIYAQMSSERQAVATKYRADGSKQARTITAEAQKNATIIEAQAYEQAEKIKGEGDAEALSIYAEAYSLDPDFYEFWRTLQSYRKVIDEDTTIIISPDSAFAKYLYQK